MSTIGGLLSHFESTSICHVVTLVLAARAWQPAHFSLLAFRVRIDPPDILIQLGKEADDAVDGMTCQTFE